MSETREYSTCPFCGSNAVGPSYSKYEFRGKIYHTATISCSECAAHGPVRNDYPADPVANGAKAEEVECWIKNAWNRHPAVTPQEAAALDHRFHGVPAGPGFFAPSRVDAEFITNQQISIALAKLYSGCAPGDEMWCELDYEALEYALGHPVDRKPTAGSVTGE